MSGRRNATLALVVFAFAAGAQSQGLGDTAAKERQKRAEKKPRGKSFTNDDLDKGRPPGSKPAGESSDASPAPAEVQSYTPPEEDRLAQERPYIDGIRAAEAEVTAAEGRIRELAARLNPMSTTYIYGASGSNDANEELRVREELRQAESQLQAARQAVVDANRQLQDFRRGGLVESPGNR